MLILKDLGVYIIMSIGLRVCAESQGLSWVTGILGLKTEERQAGPDRCRRKVAAVPMEVYLKMNYPQRNELSRKKTVGLRGE